MKVKQIQKKETKQKEWQIRLYKTEKGKCPVNDFIKTLNEKDKENMTKQILYLKEVGEKLTMPHGKKLRDDIYELHWQIITREHFIFSVMKTILY